MNEQLPIDVMTRLQQDFGDQANEAAHLLLAHRRIGSAEYFGDRLVRCIVCAARGDQGKMGRLIELCATDYRDVIVVGEYDAAMRQVRDLRVSFLIDDPVKFWIGEVACLMESRGYRLVQLDSHPATVQSAQFTASLGEGRAVFLGPKGNIEVEKKDGQWALHGSLQELQMCGLNRVFSDESEFRDTVSGYLLSNNVVTKNSRACDAATGPKVRKRWWHFWNNVRDSS